MKRILTVLVTRTLLLCGVFVFALTVSSAQATPIVAVIPGAGGFQNHQYNSNSSNGWEFTLSSALEVSGLGYLQIGAGHHATLTLLHPAPYSQVAILASSGNAVDIGSGVTGIVSISYADDGSFAATYNTFDWCNNARHPQAALPPTAGFTGTGRDCPGNLSLPQNETSFVYNAACIDFNIYETIIPTDNTRNIANLTFIASNSANWTNIFGVSGIQ